MHILCTIALLLYYIFVYFCLSYIKVRNIVEPHLRTCDARMPTGICLASLEKMTMLLWHGSRARCQSAVKNMQYYSKAHFVLACHWSCLVATGDSNTSDEWGDGDWSWGHATSDNEITHQVTRIPIHQLSLMKAAKDANGLEPWIPIVTCLHC